jgi:hypothetical protein
MQKFDFVVLEQVVLCCEECGWIGKGFETDKKFDYLPQSIEICCPVCGNYFGEVDSD